MTEIVVWGYWALPSRISNRNAAGSIGVAFVGLRVLWVGWLEMFVSVEVLALNHVSHTIV